MAKPKYQLAFWGDATNSRFPRFKRNHATLSEAKAEAYRILGKLSNRGAHPAIIYDDDDNQVMALS